MRPGVIIPLLLCGHAVAVSGVDASAEGWRTTARRIVAAPAPAAAPAQTPRASWRPAPARADVEPSPLGDAPLYALRTPLATAPNAPPGPRPYLGAGVRPADRGAAAAALLGGVAAPFVEDAVVYGELQQLSGGGSEDERRVFFGVRRGF